MGTWVRVTEDSGLAHHRIRRRDTATQVFGRSIMFIFGLIPAYLAETRAYKSLQTLTVFRSTVRLPFVHSSQCKRTFGLVPSQVIES